MLALAFRGEVINMDNPIEGEIENQPLTPLPRKEGQSITMNFPDAMNAVIAGKKVARISWGNDDYGFIKDEWLTIFTNGAFHKWLVSESDMTGEDWFIKEANARN